MKSKKSKKNSQNDTAELVNGTTDRMRIEDAVRPFLIPKGAKDRRVQIGEGWYEQRVQSYHRWTCLLWTDTDDPLKRGTGWLAGPRLVVTAAHVLDRASSVLVVPYCKGKDSNGRLVMPFGSCTATDFYMPPQFPGPEYREFDFAFIVLPEAFAIGNSLGWFNVQSYEPNELVPDRIGPNLLGYPVDKPFDLWGDSWTIAEAQEHMIWYKMHAEKGQSGGPVFYRHNPPISNVGQDADGELGNTVIAMHTGTRSRGNVNSGVRITSDIIRMINDLNRAPSVTPTGLRKYVWESPTRNLTKTDAALMARFQKLCAELVDLKSEIRLQGFSVERNETTEHQAERLAELLMNKLDNQARKNTIESLKQWIDHAKFIRDYSQRLVVSIDDVSGYATAETITD